MNLNYSYVIPECFVDTNLIEYLMHGTVNHQHGCSNVVGTLKRSFSERFAIGIIDNDKDGVGYLHECDEIAQSTHLCVMKHRELPHFLITVDPAMDRFLLDCAIELGVDTAAYNIPSELKAFTKRSKKTSSNRDKDFRNLIVAIRDHPEIVALRNTLHYLQMSQFQSDSNYIKELFESL